ncbi:MAG: hypothetical protein Q9217_002526 [Psora testacea]
MGTRTSADSRNFLLQPKTQGGPLNGLFVDDRKAKKPDKEEDVKVKAIQQCLLRAGITTFKDSDISYVLSTPYSSGDIERAHELLILLEDSEQGLIRPYDPSITLLGAVNREGVTCYLDALLFAMFAKLGSFEAMLYKNFEDERRKRLATLLRLWVNVLRAGRLITTDITKQIQLQLASCGWKEAAEIHQQDASEAFTFITETLALPLLTLKMDIFHTGKEDTNDDHKFINERLLELAIPEEPKDGHVITLEDCLEMFFNNKIEVKRYLDSLERRNTVTSVRSRMSVSSTKAHASHIEVAEIGASQSSSPVSQDQPEPIPTSPVRPTRQRQRAPSIIQEHYINEKHGLQDGTHEETGGHPRTRKEVMMPAWQFFSLIPWYTNNKPTTDAQVAAHFSSTRPILGICLKRYSMLPNGTAMKRRTHIDIPLEIGLPHFISDDDMSGEGPAFGNFKLSLQSVVCHQGVSVESGHYISFVRHPDPEGQGQDRWMRLDDLARERVVDIDIEEQLKRESPYLLFYQVMPIEGEPDHILNGDIPLNGAELPPSYADSTGSRGSKVDSGVGDVTPAPKIGEDVYTTADRPSIDTSASEEGKRGRSSMASDRRQSILVSDTSDEIAQTSGITIDIIGSVDDNTATSAPGARVDSNNLNEGTNSLPASRRGSKTTKASSKSRPGSQAGEGRLSTSLSNLANRMSRDKVGNNTPILPHTPRTPMEKASSTTTAARASWETAANSRISLVVDEVDKAHDKARSRKEAREKSKLLKEQQQQHLSNKGSKPDRECVVM